MSAESDALLAAKVALDQSRGVLVQATAAQVKATAQRVATDAEFIAWITGSATGGPGGDGRYPITAADGTVALIPCPATFGSGGGGGPVTPTLKPAVVTIWSGQSNAQGTQQDTTTTYQADALTKAYHKVNGLVPYAPNSFTGYGYTVPVAKWGPELRYAERFRAAQPTMPHFILKWAASGTQIFQSPGGTSDVYDWNVNSTGELFAQGATYITQALAAIVAAGFDPTVRLLHWQQGENDCNAEMSPSYQANLMALIAGWHQQWSVSPSANIYIGRLSSQFGLASYRNTIRAAQEYAAAQDVGGPVTIINCDDLVLESDHTHFTNAAQLMLGDRIADTDNLGASVSAPGAVSSFTGAAASAATIQLAFGAAVGATSYQYRLNGGAWTTLASNKVISGLSPATAYAVQVRGLNTAGSGPVSSTVNVTTPSSASGILANGTFDSAASWGGLIDGRTISDGKLHFVDSQPYNYAAHSGVPFIAGVAYDVTFTISSYVTGSVRISFAADGTGTGAFGTLFRLDGTYTARITAAAGDNVLRIMSTGNSGSGGTTLDIDNVTVQQA